MAGALAAGCAGAGAPRAEAPPARGAEAAPAEDALPVFLDEAEVDVPARPRAPIRPEYPSRARAQGLEGDALLRVYVTADGRVAGLRALEEARSSFTAAAAAAVRATPFAPGRLEGRPVGSSVTVRVRFRLD